MTVLRQLAEAATPGPWSYDAYDGSPTCSRYEVYRVHEDQEIVATATEQDASYIAAASPDVVLGLLDDRDAARDMLRRVEWAGNGYRCPECGRRMDEGHAPDCELARLIGGG